MTVITDWGPKTWRFFHTLAAHIRDDPALVTQTFWMIVQICHLLPCPECTMHAKQVCTRVNMSNMTNKAALKDFLCYFHNVVNARKKKPVYSAERLVEYDGLSIIEVYNDFYRHFHTHGDMQQLTQSFHRQRMLLQLKQWMVQRLQARDLMVVRPMTSVLTSSK